MSSMFRVSATHSATRNLAKTLLQTTVFWGVFLWVIPHAIADLETSWRIPRPNIPFGGVIALVGFLMASALGLWSGATMAIRGKGTPLPIDTASRLVVAGPYAYVRNPMAVAGLAQGFFVGVWLESGLTWAYAALGGLLWHWTVRPIEERDLRQRFGAEYDAYVRRVRCWAPRLQNES